MAFLNIYPFSASGVIFLENKLSGGESSATSLLKTNSGGKMILNGGEMPPLPFLKNLHRIWKHMEVTCKVVHKWKSYQY